MNSQSLTAQLGYHGQKAASAELVPTEANTSLSAPAQMMLCALPLSQLTQFWIQVLSACDWQSLSHIQNP